MKNYSGRTVNKVLLSIVLALVITTALLVGCFAGSIETYASSNADIASNVSSQNISASSQYVDMSSYESKVYDSNKPITEFIPSYLFTTVGEQQYVGRNYGFFIKTSSNLDGFGSNVLLFETLRENNEDNNTYSYTVKPVLDELYVTIDGATEISNARRDTYLTMSNIQYYANLINTHEGHAITEYDKNNDNGYFAQGAYTEGNYLILEEDNPSHNMVKTTASYIFGKIVEEIPGVSFLLGVLGLITDLTDWQEMIAVNNVPHIHYGDYNTQLNNGFNRNVLLRDNDQARYIRAEDDQQISFVIEYDNKNRNDIEAQIRNMLSFNIYEFKESGKINLGEAKINTHNDYENHVVTNFNDLTTQAEECKYELVVNNLAYNESYTNLYLTSGQVGKFNFIPDVTGYYEISSNGSLSCTKDGSVVDINNSILEKDSIYEITISNLSNDVSETVITRKQELTIGDNCSIVEGANIVSLNFSDRAIRIYSATGITQGCSFMLFDDNYQLINSSNIINGDLSINYLFEAKDYYLVIYSTDEEILNNVIVTVNDAETVGVNDLFTKTISNNSDYYVKLDFDYTCIYSFDVVGDISIMDTSTFQFKPVENDMLINANNHYYIKIVGNDANNSFRMRYTGAEIKNGESLIADKLVNNVFQFDCVYTANYTINNIENLLIIEADTYTEVPAANGVARLESGNTYIIIETVINSITKNIKLEIDNEEIELGRKIIANSSTAYKLTADFSGKLNVYPADAIMNLYDENLNKLNGNNIVKSETYYLSGGTGELILLPQHKLLPQGEAYFSGTDLFEVNLTTSVDKRLTVIGNGGNMSYSIQVYDAQYDIVFEQEYSNSYHLHDIILSLNAGKYYIGVFNANRSGYITLEDKVKEVAYNETIEVNATSNRTLDYVINIAKTTIYNFVGDNCTIEIDGKNIDSSGNVTLSNGKYNIRIIGNSDAPVESSFSIAINAAKIGIVCDNATFDNNTIYELIDFQPASYEFISNGNYKFYDTNLEEIVVNGELSFDKNTKYYIELVGGGNASYKFVKTHDKLNENDLIISMKANTVYYFALGNLNLDFLALSASNANVVITIYNDLGQSSESILAQGTELVFAYSEKDIRYVSFSSKIDLDAVSVKLVDPKANVTKEIYCNQNMDMGKSYFKFTTSAKGKYVVRCEDGCNNVKVYDENNRIITNYEFELGETYTIEHNSSSNTHSVSVELVIDELAVNEKNIVKLNQGMNYFAINISLDSNVFSTTHSLNVYQTIQLDNPIINVARNNVGLVEKFSSSSRRIIEVESTADNAELVLYIWEDLKANDVMMYRIGNDSNKVLGDKILLDIRNTAYFSLPDKYNGISEFGTTVSYKSPVVEGVSLIKKTIQFDIKINGVLVNSFSKVVDIERIGKPDDMILVIDSLKDKYNGFDSFTYEVIMRSGSYVVTGYTYTVFQNGGYEELIINSKTATVTFDQDKDLYGNYFDIYAYSGDIYSDSVRINVAVDQTVDYYGWYKERVPTDSKAVVQLGVESTAKTLRINLGDFQTQGSFGLVLWIFDIPSHIKYVEIDGNNEFLQFVSIRLNGNSILKVNRLSFMAITSAISAKSDATIMIQNTVIMWGNTLMSLDDNDVPTIQEVKTSYPNIDVKGQLKLILFDDAALNAKGGIGAWGEGGANGSQGAKGADGWAGQDGATGGTGGTGGAGKEGKRGNVGIKANKINLILNRSPRLMIEGGAGGQGGMGGVGGKGGQGGADTSWWDCGPGAGGDGGQGGKGGDGGYGGYALDCDNHNIPSQYLINHNNERSTGGQGGNGGRAGEGGNGGASGGNGPSGSSGRKGADGTTGTYDYKKYGAEIFGVIND